MTTVQRRFYMLFFVALFFMTAPVLVLFAQGYRFDKHGKIFVYSGSVTVKSWPRDIDIYIDNKKQDKKKLNAVNRSYTINGIRPGKYTVRCEKEGHTSWSKTVEVHSGISTEMWNVLLFPTENREESSFSQKNIDQFFLSPRSEGELLFLSKEDNQSSVSLLEITTEENKTETIFETEDFDFMDKSDKENIEWSSDKKRILIPFTKDDEKVFVIARIKKENLRDIVNLNSIFIQGLENFDSKEKVSSEETDLATTDEVVSTKTMAAADAEEVKIDDTLKKQLSRQQFEKVRWMFDKNDELVVLTKNHELFYLNIENPEEMLLIDDQVSGFDFAGNRIYYTRLPNNIVWEIKNDNTETKKQITNTPVPTGDNEFVKIFAYDQYRIAIITEKNDLYLYNNEKETDEITMDKLTENISDIQFSDDGKKLLYWTNNEIWLSILRDWDVQPIRKKGDKKFITRFSQQVKNVQWMDSYENIIFSTGDTIKSASVDTRDYAYVSDVIKLPGDIEEREVFYGKSNQKLFILKKQNGESVIQSILVVDRTGFFGF